jgi:hypothetical protein
LLGPWTLPLSLDHDPRYPALGFQSLVPAQAVGVVVVGVLVLVVVIVVSACVCSWLELAPCFKVWGANALCAWLHTTGVGPRK